MSELPHPSVSTGTIPAGMSQEFFNVSIIWKGKKETRMMGPDDVAYYGDRAEGKQRLFDAAYFVLRDGNRCMGRYPGICAMGDSPFANPSGADFDHINGRRTSRLLKDIQLMCSSCNSHKQNEERRLQWKQTPAAASSQKRESIGGSPPEASSLESAKHDPQRAAWDRIIADGSVFKELERQGLMTENSKFGSLFLAQDLAEIAVSLTVDPVFGKYSSETFARYAREDRFDKLEMIKDAGRWWVKPRI